LHHRLLEWNHASGIVSDCLERSFDGLCFVDSYSAGNRGSCWTCDMFDRAQVCASTCHRDADDNVITLRKMEHNKCPCQLLYPCRVDPATLLPLLLLSQPEMVVWTPFLAEWLYMTPIV
jgi:hypothetical protein